MPAGPLKAISSCAARQAAFLIQHQRAAYYDTLRKLHALHRGGGASIRLTHESAEDYLPLGKAAP